MTPGLVAEKPDQAFDFWSLDPKSPGRHDVQLAITAILFSQFDSFEDLYETPFVYKVNSVLSMWVQAFFSSPVRSCSF